MLNPELIWAMGIWDVGTPLESYKILRSESAFIAKYDTIVGVFIFKTMFFADEDPQHLSVKCQ